MNDGGELGPRWRARDHYGCVNKFLASTFDIFAPLERFQILTMCAFVMNWRQHLVPRPEEKDKVETNSKKLVESKQGAETF